ncbi:TonB-dependent receptor [Candidimonas nitroreducens]|uniref:TonB-dependent siderophore receptor n=1 Tax=Candidimonas nitroreducens TaxID=683354 RepID=A0A225MY07_9BURK|nr:TonB-dependent receptor [Candidimonas nitroreducens]OWT66267.1 TonB-dependent siderophore receptor [Candidimonas nitroreducens]
MARRRHLSCATGTLGRTALSQAMQGLVFAFACAACATVQAQPAAASRTATQAADFRQPYKIAPGALDDALANFAAAARVSLTIPPVLTRGKTAAGLDGSYTVGEGFARLLAGSGLEAVAGSGGVYVLRQAPADISGAGVTTLPAIAVQGQAGTGGLPPVYAGGQVASGGRLGMLGNTDVMDTPFNQTSYTSELIADQQARSVGDVLDNDPSVRRAWPASGFYEYFQIRGFNVNSGDIAFNGLYGIIPRYGAVPVDFAERIEVLKGPSALLGGMSPNGVVGGAINLVPKRAGNDPLTRLSLGLESDSLWHTNVDIGRRFGQNKEWGVRFNGGYSSGDTYIDGQSKRGSNTGSLALDYRGDRVRVALDAYRIEDRNRDGSSLAVSLADGLTAVPRAPDGSTNISPWASGNARTEGVVLSGEVDLADHLTAYAKAGYRHYQYSGYLLSSVYNVQANGDANTLVMQFPYDTHGDSEEIGLRGAFDTGPVRHTLVLSGARQTDYVKDNYSYNPFTTNIYAPRTPVLPSESVQPLKDSTMELSSLAVADTLSMFDERVLLTLGVRRQNVETENFDHNSGAMTARYDQGAWTPMLGLVVKPYEHLSLYGNVIEGLSAGATVGNTYQNAGEVFPPYKTKQIEVGAKLETGRVTNTLSLFEIRKPSTLADYSTSPLPTLRLDGEQRNRGIEWNIFGEITPRLRVLGGVTYIQGRLTRTQGGAYDGNEAPGAAPWATNLGVEWDVPGIAGLTLSGRVINTSSQYVDNANKLKIPNWTRVDVGARYATKVSATPVVFRAGIHNLFDKNYWEGVNSPGTITLGAPRTFMLSATIDF